MKDRFICKRRSVFCLGACGFFDRALEIHAALLSMRKVDSVFLDSILIDLTKDYIGAGLYDKAYQALELIENETYYRQALELRLKINQRLKQWEPALKTLKDLENHSGEEYENLRIHFFCELIENGATEYKKKLKEKNPDHKRAKELLSNKNKISLECGILFVIFVLRSLTISFGNVICAKLGILARGLVTTRIDFGGFRSG